MTALPYVAGCLKLSLDWTVGSDPHATTVLHFGYTGTPPTSAQLNTVAIQTGVAFDSSLKPQYFNGGGLYTVTATDLSSASAAQATAVPNISGTKTGSILPRAVCVLFNHHIARRYRGGKGRSYVPLGVSSDIGTNGNWQPAFVSACQTNWAGFIVNIISGSAGAVPLTGQVIVSYFSGGAIRGTPLLEPVLSTTANEVPGTQRRRNWL